jgi:hypothetical protein
MTVYRVSSADKHTIKIWWNSIHYWGSNHSFRVFHKVPPVGQTVHRNVPNNNPIRALVMGNMMLTFHNDSSEYAQVRSPTTSRRRFRFPFSETPPIGLTSQLGWHLLETWWNGLKLTENLHLLRRYRAEGNFGFKVTRVKVKRRIATILSRDTPLSPDTSSHQISTKNIQLFRNYRVEGKYYAIWGHGHWVKVKGHIDTNIWPDTPLSPDTSSHQISTKNVHSFRKYRAEGILVTRSQGQGQRSHQHDSFARHTFVPWYITHANFTKNSCSVNELQTGHEIVDSRPPRLIFKMAAWRPKNRSNCKNEKNLGTYCP